MHQNMPKPGTMMMAAMVAVVAGLFSIGVPGAMGAEVIKTCQLEAAGDGCVFDLTATGSDFLTVDTKAGTEGDRWRATISEVNLPGAISAVGTGSATAFTGAVRRRVFSERTYEVFITFEAPLPDPFGERSVDVRVNGPVDASGPRPISPVFPAPVEVTGQTTRYADGDDGDI